MAGRFVVFEGPDGSGKSTALAAVAERLRARGEPVLATREPGGSEAAEVLRTALLTPALGGAPVASQLLLITAARLAHLEQTVRPALREGCTVLCDRYVDSSHVYQCSLGGVSHEALEALNTQWDIPPADLRLYFELPAEVALARLESRPDGNRMDAADATAWTRVARAYAEQMRRNPRGLRRVDASLDPQAVVARILEILDDEGA